MALSGSVTTTSSDNRSVTLSWTATQSVANNTSTVSWSLAGSGSSTGWVRVNEIRVTINGSQAYYRSSSNHTECWQGTVLATGSQTITHNSDGTKSFTIKVEAGIYNWAINCSGSNTFTLTTIPRSSSISSAGNITLGNACSVKWTPAASSFKYKVKFTLGDYNSGWTSFISPNSTSAYTYSGFTIPASVANQLPSKTTGTMTAYLATYNSRGTQIGSIASKTFTVTIPSTVIPTIGTVTATIDNSSNSTIRGWGVAVAGYTKVKLTASASGSYGSTISSFTVNGSYSTTQNGTSLSYTGGVISTSGSKTFTVVAKDSRSRSSASKSSSAITFYAYSAPKVTSFTVQRSSSNSLQMIVKANWSFSDVNGHNSATATLKYKKSNVSSWTTYGEIAKNTNVTLTGVNFDETSSYNFQVIVTDSLSKTAKEEAFVPTIAVLIDLRAGGKGLGIGKVAETNSLEIALPTVFMNEIKIKDGIEEINLHDYIRKVFNEIESMESSYFMGGEINDDGTDGGNEGDAIDE